MEKADTLAEHAKAGAALWETEQIARVVEAGKLKTEALGESCDVLAATDPLIARHVSLAGVEHLIKD